LTCLQHQRLAVSEDMHAGGWCQASDMVGEGHGRQIDQIGALGKPDRPPCAPMDWDGTIWVSAADRLCRLLGVEMTVTQGGSPASDWHQGEVGMPHLVERNVCTRVPRIPAPVGADNKIAECWSAMRAPRVSSAVMVGSQDAYLEAAKLNEVTWLDLAKLHAAGGDWFEQPARAHRGDENRGGRNQSQRGQVGVVGVEV
jgi:hypothetical protein